MSDNERLYYIKREPKNKSYVEYVPIAVSAIPEVIELQRENEELFKIKQRVVIANRELKAKLHELGAGEQA